MPHDDYSGHSDGRSDDAPESSTFDLFNLPPEPPARAELTDPEWQDLTPSQRFERFHGENPEVYRQIVTRCREWHQAGNGKLGMSLLFGVIRWQLALQTKGDPYKINDRHAAYYARLVMWLEPDLDGVFEVRRSAEADAWIDELKARAA